MNKFEKLFKKAERNLRIYQYDKAIRQFYQCLALNEEDDQFWSRLAYTYNLKGNYDEAIKASKQALNLNDNSIDALNNLFFAYDQQSEFDEEIKVLKKFLENPLKADYLSERQKISDLLKNPEKINDLVYSRVLPFKNGGIIKIDPRDFKNFDPNAEPEDLFKVFYNKLIGTSNNNQFIPKKKIENSIAYNIETLFSFSNIEKSPKKINLLKLLLEHFPMDLKIWNNLASTYSNKGELDEAIETYNKILEIVPNNLSVLRNLGVIYIKKEFYQSAIEIFEQLIDIQSKKLPESQENLDTDVWYHLGFAYSQTGEEYKAIEAYKNALKIDPNEKHVLNGLGNSYNKIGEYKKAIKACLQALDIDPKFANPWNHLGAAYHGIGELGKAIESIKMALKINPKYSLAWKFLASIYFEENDYKNAKDSYRNLVDLEPNDFIAWYYLSNTLLELGLIEDAFNAINRSLELNKDYKPALEFHEKLLNLKK